MEVYVNEISGIADAIAALHMSTRTWTKELDDEIRLVCDNILTRHGMLNEDNINLHPEQYEKFKTWMNKLTKWGKSHITLLKFIDISVCVKGLHRGGQDDWDSHAKRFDNRIVRNSTRIKNSNFGYEMSDWYKNKIIPTDVALNSILDIELPDTINIDGKTYIKRVNGYILEGFENNNDVKRGLYMLSIPSDFIFKVNLTEWSHVFKERNKNGTANPEVKECCESIADQIESFHEEFNRDLFNAIKN